MKKLSKTETALKKRVAYEKNMYFKRTYAYEGVWIVLWNMFYVIFF